jgi:hypothetical protein
VSSEDMWAPKTACVPRNSNKKRRTAQSLARSDGGWLVLSLGEPGGRAHAPPGAASPAAGPERRHVAGLLPGLRSAPVWPEVCGPGRASVRDFRGRSVDQCPECPRPRSRPRHRSLSGPCRRHVQATDCHPRPVCIAAGDDPPTISGPGRSTATATGPATCACMSASTHGGAQAPPPSPPPPPAHGA